MAFKIYTKTGDKGETSLFGGARLPKSHLRIEAYGTIDELNAQLGLLRDHVENENIRDVILQIQNRLFTIGANLASDPSKKMATPDIIGSDVQLLEQQIDLMEENLPSLKNFILPGGHPVVSICHIARCVCRRAERRMVALSLESPVLPILIQYVNRLSDYLFVLGRYVGEKLGAKEVVWNPRNKG